MTSSTLSNVAQQHPGRTKIQLTQPKQVHGFTEIDKYLLTKTSIEVEEGITKQTSTTSFKTQQNRKNRRQNENRKDKNLRTTKNGKKLISFFMPQ